MTNPVPLRWGWCTTAEPPAPRAAVVHGTAAGALARQLLELPSARREALQFLVTTDSMVVLGATGDLPWIEGVRYAAPSADAPALWLPTHLQPDVPHDLLSQAVRKRHGREPVLLWPAPAMLIPLDRPQALGDGALAMAAERLATPRDIPA